MYVIIKFHISSVMLEDGRMKDVIDGIDEVIGVFNSHDQAADYEEDHPYLKNDFTTIQKVIDENYDFQIQ